MGRLFTRMTRKNKRLFAASLLLVMGAMLLMPILMAIPAIASGGGRQRVARHQTWLQLKRLLVKGKRKRRSRWVEMSIIRRKARRSGCRLPRLRIMRLFILDIILKAGSSFGLPISSTSIMEVSCWLFRFFVCVLSLPAWCQRIKRWPRSMISWPTTLLKLV